MSYTFGQDWISGLTDNSTDDFDNYVIDWNNVSNNANTQTPSTTQPAGTGFANVLNSLSGFIGSTSSAINNTQLPQVQVEAKPDKNTNMLLIGIAGLLAIVLLKK
jgi:hypothetical protein